jgi:hypothetical protein
MVEKVSLDVPGICNSISSIQRTMFHWRLNPLNYEIWACIDEQKKLLFVLQNIDKRVRRLGALEH